MAEKKATMKTMEKHFTGESIVGETQSGHEDFPSKRLSVVAKEGAAPSDALSSKTKSTKAQNEE